MINRLKEVICLKLGRDVSNRGDCQLLSQHILLETGEYVNYNTLRRFFGIDKNPVKPRVQTLDILCQYAGYNSFEAFVALKPQQRYFEQHLKTAEILHYSDPTRIKIYFEAIRSNQNQIINFLVELIRNHLLRGRLKELCAILDSIPIHVKDFSYDEVLYIGNMVGLSLRSMQPALKTRSPLLKNRFFNAFVFEIFVDYTCLNHYYSHFINYLHQSPQQEIFKHCLLQLKSYLNLSPGNLSQTLLQKALTIELHPILKGRLISLQLYNSDVSINWLNHFSKDYTIEIWYEPMVASIITSDFKFFDIIEKEIKSNFTTRTYRHNHYFQVFFLFKACYQYKTNQANKAIYTLSLIDMDALRISYKDLLSFFIHILTWKLHQNQSAKAAAIELSLIFNYPKFDRSFIDNY